MYLFFGNAIGSTFDGSAGRDWWPGKMRGDALNEQTLLTERDVQRSWNFVNLCERRCGASAQPLFLVRLPAVWVVTLSVCLAAHLPHPHWGHCIVAHRDHRGRSTYQCRHKTVPRRGVGGGGGIKWCKHRGVSSAGGVYWVGHRGQKPPTSFAHMLVETFLLTPPPAPGNNFFHFRTRVWLSQSAGKLSICWLSLGRNSLLLLGMIMRLSLPSRRADSLLLCGLIPFNTTQQKKKRWVAIVLSPQWPLSTPTNCAAREGSRSCIYLFIFTMQMCKGIKRHRCTEITLQHSWIIATTPGTPVQMGFSSVLSLCNLSAAFKSWQN